MKVCCQEKGCGWVGSSMELQYINHPFNKDDYIEVCPKCHTIETSIQQACDVQGCDKPASCGTPTKAGYRNTCHNHMPVNDLTGTE